MMPSLSHRAFEQSRRRKQYADRRGLPLLCSLQHDAVRAIGEVASAALAAHDDMNDIVYQQHLARAVIPLLAISGALGFDLLAAVEHELGRQEMVVLRTAR